MTAAHPTAADSASGAERKVCRPGMLGFMALRALLVFALVAAVETVHGVLRVRLLNRRLGDRRARQGGAITGSGLILLVAVAIAPGLAAVWRGVL